MKVLHVAESIRGGCGTYLNELLPGLIAESGSDDVRVLAPDRHLSQLPDVAPRAIRSFRRPARAIGLLFLTVRLIATIREFRPDVIHAHSTFAGAIARVLAIFLPRVPPIVYCPHGWVFDTARSSAMRRRTEAVERFLARWCVAIVAISNAEKRAGEAAGISSGRIVVIHNGIRPSLPIRTVAVWTDTRLRALFVGRLDRQKGLDVLLEAVRPLEKAVAVRVVGAAVVSRGRNPGDCANVEYLGWLCGTQVAAQIEACDVVVMPSRWEGFGLVALEAMRSAKPVIASRVGGLAEIVVDGVTGRLVRAGDPGAVRAALLADSAQERARMGSAGLERFQALYSIDRTRTQLDSLYRAVVNGSAQGALDWLPRQ